MSAIKKIIKDEKIEFRVTESQKKEIYSAAKKFGEKPTPWILAVLLREAARNQPKEKFLS